MVAKQSLDAGCRGAAPIMESLLCGLGLGSDEPTADERQQASSSSWTALSSYITGTTATTGVALHFSRVRLAGAAAELAAAPGSVADRSPRAVARRGRLGC